MRNKLFNISLSDISSLSYSIPPKNFNMSSILVKIFGKSNEKSSEKCDESKEEEKVKAEKPTVSTEESSEKDVESDSPEENNVCITKIDLKRIFNCVIIVNRNAKNLIQRQPNHQHRHQNSQLLIL